MRNCGQDGLLEVEEDRPRIDFITLIISPLSSLMLEQATRLTDLGIDAKFIGELQSDPLFKESVVQGKVELLLLTPEAIFDSGWRKVLTSAKYSNRIKAVVIDEAHCISHW